MKGDNGELAFVLKPQRGGSWGMAILTGVGKEGGISEREDVGVGLNGPPEQDSEA